MNVITIFLRNKKQIQYMRNYYLAYKNELLDHFIDFLNIPRAIKFISLKYEKIPKFLYEFKDFFTYKTSFWIAFFLFFDSPREPYFLLLRYSQYFQIWKISKTYKTIIALKQI